MFSIEFRRSQARPHLRRGALCDGLPQFALQLLPPLALAEQPQHLRRVCFVHARRLQPRRLGRRQALPEGVEGLEVD